jgi:hypothetical protein
VVKAAVIQECGFHRNQERLIASARQYGKGFTSDLNSSGMAHDDNADLYDRVIASVTVAAADDVGDGLDGHVDEEVYERGPEVRKISGLSTDERRSVITPEILSRRFGIGLESAKKTLRVERASPDRAKGTPEIGSPEVSNSVWKDLHGHDDSKASVDQAIQGSAGLPGRQRV